MPDRVFDAWSVPDGIDVPPPTEPSGKTASGAGGLTIRHLPHDPAWVDDLLLRLEFAREELLARPSTEIAEVLGRVGNRFADPEDPLRARALELLPDSAGLSRPMAEAVLDGMAKDWSMTRLRMVLEAEFGDPRILDGFVPDGPRQVRAFARSPALHVGAGTVPGVTVTSMIRALLVKGAVLVKPGMGDHVLPVLFREALAELDPALAQACAVVYWPGNKITHMPAGVRALVLYGDDSTIAEVRSQVPVSTRVVAYPHRVSFALIGRDQLELGEMPAAVARAVTLYERRGCVSPHQFYVEEKEAGDARGFGRLVARALTELGETLPPPASSLGDAAIYRQWVTTLRMTQAGGSNLEIFDTATHGVVVVGDPGSDVLPPGRVVLLRPVADLVNAIEDIDHYGPQVQSVALDVEESRRGWLSEALVRAGALRITTLDRLPWPPAWWHHDGQGGLAPLVDLIDREG